MKSLHIKRAFFILLSLSSLSAMADNHQDKVDALKAQLNKIPTPIQVPHTQTESIIDDGETITTVALIDHSKSPFWELTSVNNQTPTNKQIKKYKKRAERGFEDNEKDPLLGILNPSSLSFVKSTDEFDVFAFDPVFSEFKEEAKHDIDGRIFVNKQNQIERILIKNPESFSPVFSVSMNTFLLDYDVKYHQDTPYISYYELLVDAKIGGFKKLQMQSNASYSDIQW